MPFLSASDFKSREVFPGVTIRVASSERMTYSFLTFSPRAVLKEHKHPHEQFGVVLEGGFELTIGGEKRVVKAGDTYVIPSNVPHSGVALDAPARVLDVFSPPREDYR
jgi:quercetin dioxygenase-like cupin family protein